MRRPKVLNLPADEELIVAEDLEIFQKNGFDFVFDWEAPVTQRVKMTAFPYSKNTQFDENGTPLPLTTKKKKIFSQTCLR